MKKVIIFALLLTLAMTTLVFSQEAFDRARQAYGRKDWDGVIRYSRQVVDEFPEWFWGHYLLGKGYFNKNQYENSSRSMVKAVDFAENADDSFRAKFGAAEAYYRARDYNNTLRWISSAERHRSSKYYGASADNIAGMKGYANYNTNKFSEAIKSFKPLVDSGKASADVLRAVALSYQNTNNDAQAIATISQVVRKDATDLDAHRILIKSYLNSSQWREALNAANIAIQQDDRDWEIHYFKGRAQVQLRQHSAAETSLRRSLAISSSQDKVRKQLADTLVSLGKFFDAATEYNRAQRSYGSDPIFYYNLAFSWVNYVPKDAENYKGTPRESDYLTALENAKTTLTHLKTLSGADMGNITDLEGVIANKEQRLKEGKFIKEMFEYRLNPETGEVEKVRIEGSN